MRVGQDQVRVGNEFEESELEEGEYVENIICKPVKVCLLSLLSSRPTLALSPNPHPNASPNPNPNPDPLTLTHNPCTNTNPP